MPINEGFQGTFGACSQTTHVLSSTGMQSTACALECHANEQESVTTIDIGCGSGLLSILAAQNPHVSKVWGVDTNADAIKLATKNAKRVLGPELVGKGKKLEFVLTATRRVSSHHSQSAYDNIRDFGNPHPQRERHEVRGVVHAVKN